MSQKSLLFLGLLVSFLLLKIGILFAYEITSSNLIDYSNYINQIVPSIKLIKEDKDVKIVMEVNIPEPIKNSTKINRFEIYRNNTLITETTENQYEDKNLEPGIYDYKYTAHLTISLKSFVTSTTVYSPVTSTTIYAPSPPFTTTTATTATETTKETTSTPEFLKIKIYGKTLTSDGNILGRSKVFINTEKDGFFEIESRDNGEFYIEVSNFQNISLSSVKTIDSIIYRSKIINIALENYDQNINIYLEQEDKKIPSPIEKRVEIQKGEKIILEDKAEITIPPALVTTTNIINVAVRQTIEVPPITNFSLVSPVYEIKITDDQNKEIKSFEKEIEIKIPYSPDELKAKGLTEDQIRLGYFDEDKKNWSIIEKFSVDKINKVVIGYVKHLTKFAIISFADTTPPPPPSEIKFNLINAKKVKISWINPGQDFKYVRIYRSLDKNSWGSLLYDKVTSTEIIDKNVRWGVTYYYLIKSVDYAGNESLNTKPLAITIFKFTRHLSFGSKGNDVKKLQEILIKENVYPEKNISGYFGPLTKAAVIRLQEKYSKEILEPLKLKKGTGFVGPYTIKKLNELLNEI